MPLWLQISLAAALSFQAVMSILTFCQLVRIRGELMDILNRSARSATALESFLG